jgi:2'-5' RNA ligase
MPDPSPVEHDSLFVAFLPEREKAAEMLARGGELRERYGLSFKLRPQEQLHVTLHYIGSYHYHGPPLMVVEDAKRKCAAVAAKARPFEFKVDRVMSLRDDGGPLVLASRQVDPEAHRLSRLVRETFEKDAEPETGILHLTLGYTKKAIIEEVIAPIEWPVGEMVLIHSLVGKGQYKVLGRWPLLG